MNRFGTKLIFYSFACHYFISCAECQTIIASTSEQIKESGKQEQKVTKQDSVSNSITRRNSKKQNNNKFLLVPPPPPEQPSFIDWSNIPGIYPSFDLFNKEELKQTLARTQKQIVNAKTNLEENQSQLVEAKDKAERFGSLYTEGVISRKELNTAQKNIFDKESSVEEAKAKLTDLQLKEQAIIRRISTIKKSRLGIKYTDTKIIPKR